jgi:hypothetical protein
MKNEFAKTREEELAEALNKEKKKQATKKIIGAVVALILAILYCPLPDPLPGPVDDASFLGVASIYLVYAIHYARNVAATLVVTTQLVNQADKSIENATATAKSAVGVTNNVKDIAVSFKDADSIDELEKRKLAVDNSIQETQNRFESTKQSLAETQEMFNSLKNNRKTNESVDSLDTIHTLDTF